MYGSSLRPQEGRRESRLEATIPAAQRPPQDQQAKQEKQENEPVTSKSNSVGFKRMNIGKHDIKSLEPGEYVNDNVIDVSSPCTPSSTSVLFPCAAALLMGWFCCVQGCWAEV